MMQSIFKIVEWVLLGTSNTLISCGIIGKNPMRMFDIR